MKTLKRGLINVLVAAGFLYWFCILGPNVFTGDSMFSTSQYMLITLTGLFLCFVMLVPSLQAKTSIEKDWV